MNLRFAVLREREPIEMGQHALISPTKKETIMTRMEENRCFGRLKARELTEEETARVGGGDGWPEPDVIHSGIFARTVNPETGEPDEIGNVYT